MKRQCVAILFDSHTPYLAFRVNALQRELAARGWQEHIELRVILIGAGWSTYQWDQGELQKQYDTPLHILTPEFHGLGLRSFLHPSLPGIFAKLIGFFVKYRPKITFVGGYDRPESMFCRFLSYFNLGKVGVMHDSRFNDAESFAKNIWLELAKSLVTARYTFFMVPGRECQDYTHFLGGARKPVYRGAWNVVDNEGIAKAANDASQDDVIREHLGIEGGRPFFFLPARFVEKKNIPMVLEAFATLKKRALADDDGGPSAGHALVICGQGPLESSLKARIEELRLGGDVKLRPWLPYHLVPRACRLSTAVLLPSLYDQWGMTVNEALSAGAPVLVSNRCGAHELVQNHVNGYTFDPLNKEHLTALFSQLQSDPELVERLRSNAKPSMEEFTIKQFVQQYVRVFERYGVLPEGQVAVSCPTSV